MIFCGHYIAADASGGCAAGYIPRHPSQLYEATLEGLVLFLVLRLATHRLGWLQRPGAVTGLFLVGYSAARIALENVRMPDAGLRDLPFGLTVGIMLSVPMLIGGAWLIWRSRRSEPAGAHEPA
jgi:phosphatidylglycerol:prolipoprotein diacylglycerol transferase